MQMVLEYLQIQSNVYTSLCFSATNRVSFALNASRLVSAMIYHTTWNQCDSQHEIEERSNSPPPVSSDQMPRPGED